jgi:hypothetical protein
MRRLVGAGWPAATAAVVLAAFGAAYFFTCEPSLTVKIRWRADVDVARRAALERKFLLVNPSPQERRTVRYDLLDTSRSNLKAILDNPAVEDTTDIDRVSFSLPADYPYGSSWRWIAHRTPLLRIPGVVEGLVGVCAVVLAVSSVAAIRRRRRSAS